MRWSDLRRFLQTCLTGTVKSFYRLEIICIGKYLAVLEIELMFKILAERLGRIEITGPASRLRSYQFDGIVELPVRVMPA